MLPRKDTDSYKNPDNDPRGNWIPIPIHANHQYNADYQITKPNGIVLKRPANNYWRLSEKSFHQHVKDNRIWWGEGNSYPMIKRFLTEVQDGLVPKSIFYYDEVGGNPHGNKNLKDLFNNIKLFENPKSAKLISTLCQIATNPDDILLDFFAGSGTTADAVMQLNAEDGGNRRFILVQLDEAIPEETASHLFCTEQNLEPVISSICIERVNRAGEKLKNEDPLHSQLDIGYKVFSLKSPPNLETDAAGQIHLNTERSGTLDTLYNMMTASGEAALSDRIEEIEADCLYKVGDSHYLLGECTTTLKGLGQIFVDGYADIGLGTWLNTLGIDKDGVKVLY